MPDVFYRPEYRYLNDPLFAVLVDSFIDILSAHDMDLTADDIRAALRLAVKALAPPRRRKPLVGAGA